MFILNTNLIKRKICLFKILTQYCKKCGKKLKNISSEGSYCSLECAYNIYEINFDKITVTRPCVSKTDYHHCIKNEPTVPNITFLILFARSIITLSCSLIISSFFDNSSSSDRIFSSRSATLSAPF